MPLNRMNYWKMKRMTIIIVVSMCWIQTIFMSISMSIKSSSAIFPFSEYWGNEIAQQTGDDWGLLDGPWHSAFAGPCFFFRLYYYSFGSYGETICSERRLPLVIISVVQHHTRSRFVGRAYLPAPCSKGQPATSLVFSLFMTMPHLPPVSSLCFSHPVPIRRRTARLLGCIKEASFTHMHTNIHYYLLQ